jgi:serine/threonine protein kinase
MSKQIKPFELKSSISTDKDTSLGVKLIPKSNNKVFTLKYGEIELGREVSAGGEGTIYLTNQPNIVCKIYHPERLTSLRQKKIELMLSREVMFPGICWPVDIVKNSRGEFVGYLMPQANGKTMQTSMFVKPVLLKNFPHWRRSDLVEIAISFIRKMEYLHSLNIIVGDINPLNILVEEDKTVWFVDTDSYQIENFPCPVGTVNFTPPEIQGQDYGAFLRTKNHELFAVATMIFMILLPGKPPFAQQGGTSPADNIRGMNFPYWCENSQESNPPEGPWTMIWANLSKKIKDGFCWTFKQNKRGTLNDWKKILQQYHYNIKQGYNSNELFPLTKKISDPMTVQCDKCGRQFEENKDKYEKIKSAGKGCLCGECFKEIRLKQLARTSKENYHETVNKQNKEYATDSKNNYNNSIDIQISRSYDGIIHLSVNNMPSNIIKDQDRFWNIAIQNVQKLVNEGVANNKNIRFVLKEIIKQWPK